jgi:predicted MFS family arabinose efflux permease
VGSGTIIALSVGSVIALSLFVLVGARAAEPILPLRLFRGSVFTISVILAFIVGFAMLGAMTFLPTYLQHVEGVSATDSGVRTLPLVVGLLVTSIASGVVVSRTGRYKIFPIAGTLVMALGLYYAAALHVVFLAAVPVALAAFVLALFLKQVPLREASGSELDTANGWRVG